MDNYDSGTNRLHLFLGQEMSQKSVLCSVQVTPIARLFVQGKRMPPLWFFLKFLTFPI